MKREVPDDHPAEVNHRQKCVIVFWPSQDIAYPYRPFSNEYEGTIPFLYVVPIGSKKCTRIQCEHAIKALSCTMASMSGDEKTFCEIEKEVDVGKCLELGGGCTGFDKTVWDEKLYEVAEQVLWFKFRSDDNLVMLLLQTREAEIAYASSDPKWGIGISKDDPRLVTPSKWHGENILGKALVRVRERLRRDSNN